MKRPQSLDSLPLTAGGFTSEGSWNENSTGRDPLTVFAWRIVASRRYHAESPRTVARRILASEHASAFKPAVLEQWQALEQPDDWRVAWTCRSIEAAVKYCGRGGEVCDWAGSQWVPKKQIIHEPPASPEWVRENVTPALEALEKAWTSPSLSGVR